MDAMKNMPARHSGQNVIGSNITESNISLCLQTNCDIRRKEHHPSAAKTESSDSGYLRNSTVFILEFGSHS